MTNHKFTDAFCKNQQMSFSTVMCRAPNLWKYSECCKGRINIYYVCISRFFCIFAL